MNLERHIAEDRALECVVYISHLAYKSSQNGVPFISPSDKIVRLTEVLSGMVIGRPSLCNRRLMISLYHIAFFFYKNNHLLCMKKIYKIILEAKQTNTSCFEDDDGKVFDNCILLLKKALPSLVIDKVSKINQTLVKECLSLYLNLHTEDNELKNGSAYLESVLYASQMIARDDNKAAVVYLICKGLQLFFEVKTIKDVDSSLSLMFKLLLSLFNCQLELKGYASAIDLVLSYVDKNMYKFGEESILHGGCFYLLCQAKLFISCQSEVVAMKTIQNVNATLEKLKSAKDKRDFIKEAGALMISFISNLNLHKTIKSSTLLNVCLGPFLEMILNLCNTLQHLNAGKCLYIYCLTSSFLLVSEVAQSRKDMLKECLNTLLKFEALFFKVTNMLRSENHQKADFYTKLVLTRCANLLHTYHLALLDEEIVSLSKPFCKFICTLPSSIFEDSSSKTSMELSFTCLIQALGPKRLYEVLEAAVAWLVVCPESSKKVFRLWGDIKHNAICDGGSEFLDTTVSTVVNQGQSSLEENWFPCNLTPDQLGDFLVKELYTYFINSTLRGSPVLVAVQDLECLTTDVVTQVRGVVVALDVTSARSEYTEQCSHYHHRSLQLLSQLKKQKNKIDPIVFNCSMAELLYAQFRFKLKSFRLDCEGEVLRLSALHQSAGPLIPELPEDQPDPDDTCDVTTRYSNLSLEKQKEILAELNTAVSHWRTACTRLTTNQESKSSKYDLRVTLKNLQEAAFIMKLYCDEIKERELWRLLYNLASLVDDTNSVVIAMGEMLKNKTLFDLKDIEEILHRPGVLERTKDAFTLNKASFYLSKNMIAEGLKLLASKTEIKKNLSSIHYINCHVILGMYQKLSNWNTHSDQYVHSPSCHMSFLKALSHLLYLTQQEKWSSLMEASQIQLTLLQVSHQLGEVNWSLEQPREARCYLKSQLSIAQKLGLPLRSSQLLLLLAWVDLHTGMMPDCAVKLEGLEVLLDLQGAPAVYEAGTDNSTKLNKVEIYDPEFLSHAKLFPGCDCFCCSCTEYQRLVMETLCLRASYCTNNDQPTLALQSFKVAFRVRDYLNKSEDLEVQTSSIRMWKCYADTLALYNRPQEEININEKTSTALPLIKQQNPILLQHILHQNSCRQNLKPGLNKSIGHRIVIETEENVSIVNTPTNKKGQVFVAKTPLSVVDGNITPKCIRQVRKLTFPSSGEENTPPPHKAVKPKSKRTIKPPTKIKIETPQTANKMLKINKTPFTIVDDDGNAVGVISSQVSSRAKKNTEVKPSSSVHKKLFKSDQMSTDKKLISSIVFKSPERKSNRQKVYGNKQSNPPLDDSLKKLESTNKNVIEDNSDSNSEIFLFEELKEEVNNIKHSIPKSTYSKSSLKRVTKSVMNSRSHPGSSKVDVESDGSVVEGTPTPPGNKKLTLRTLRPKRTVTK
ncbi:uncharacterized protein LOC128987032 isoform X2 [Macrosteles quadrilineatus]|uniref:uncharacterized protein LOC128987032 isoform X2 n=1 Tax=Macrosteles quadrilineatus TaxID=74068 RepID=UPI0023E2C68F|nr:uncharacterized protein LOC128987032 isoform X2 [Macrosteles quadrilineatus]